MGIYVNLVFEDAISEFTMFKILDSFGDKYSIGNSYPGNGFGYIKKNINGFNQASIASAFFVLTDLDSYNCPISLMQEWLNAPKNPNFIFRIAIREIESWLLADRKGFAEFTGVSIVNIPDNPDLEKDPKQTLISIAKKSRKRAVRNEIVPINNNAKIGPNYNERLMEFVSEYWDINRAAKHSESLNRAIKHLQQYNYVNLI